jgi:hypothetical protein
VSYEEEDTCHMRRRIHEDAYLVDQAHEPTLALRGVVEPLFLVARECVALQTKLDGPVL